MMRKKCHDSDVQNAFLRNLPKSDDMEFNNEDPEYDTAKSDLNKSLTNEDESDCDQPVFNPDKCIFCNLYADQEFIEYEKKKSIASRERVIQVTKKDTKESIKKNAEKYKDYLSQQVLLRIENVDLVEAKAVYHKKCSRMFFTAPNLTGRKCGRPSVYAPINGIANNDTKDIILSPECKTRWHKLRNCYNNAMKRRQMKVDKKFPPWRYEEQMSFIKPYWNRPGTLDPTEDEDPLSHTDETMYEESIEPFSPESQQNCSASSTSSYKRKATPSNDNEQSEQENVNTEPKTEQDFDELDSFFLSMSKAVKRLPRIDQIRIKMDLHRAVCEAELKFEESQQSVNTKTEYVDL